MFWDGYSVHKIGCPARYSLFKLTTSQFFPPGHFEKDYNLNWHNTFAKWILPILIKYFVINLFYDFVFYLVSFGYDIKCDVLANFSVISLSFLHFVYNGVFGIKYVFILKVNFGEEIFKAAPEKFWKWTFRMEVKLHSEDPLPNVKAPLNNP